MKYRYILIAVNLLIVANLSWSQAEAYVVDSLYNAMSVEQRIGQLLMIRAHSDLGPDHVASVRDQIERYHVGGLCFFQGTPEGHAQLIREYQELSRIPLLVAMDAEWGPGMRFRESSMQFPRQLMLGAIQDNSTIYRMGLDVGRQLLELGINVNFAPVVDININPANPVINDRSFGEDRVNVTSKSYHYMRGMQDAGIIACAKHFPGHGDTDVDSHYDLPVINHSRARLDSIELMPFEVLIGQGVKSVMVAHLQVPALDDTPNLPTTLSAEVVDTLLRQNMGFEGLIFTDALEMRGVTKHHSPGALEVKAILAGNDILALPSDVEKAVESLKLAVENGVISQERLAQSVKRILGAKLDLGLFDTIRINASADLFAPSSLALKSELIEGALTLVRNDGNLLPVRDVENTSFASLMIGGGEQTSDFQSRMDSYATVKHISTSQDKILLAKSSLLELLGSQDYVFVGLTGLTRLDKDNYGIKAETLVFLRELSSRTNVVLTIFGSPYSLKYFADFPAVIMSYESDAIAQDLTAQGIFGAISFRGRLPVTAGKAFPVNTGIMLPALGRLGYGSPERVGMNPDSLERIREIVQEMFDERAAPGCQVLIARQGKVVYNEAFGHFTYAGKRPVLTSDLYDVASITKVAATTLATMKLYEQDEIEPSGALKVYLEDLEGTNKADLVVRDVLAHQARLKPWIPFHSATVVGNGRSIRPSPDFYRSEQTDNFSIQVANNLYVKNSQRDSIWAQIKQSELRDRTGYRYSDIGFYIMAEIIERKTRSSLDAYCAQEFYRPLGLQRTRFRPLDAFNTAEIAPTEEDKSFRNQRLQGFVHDSGSALLGGVGGHAGLFSNAEGLGIILQMLLNGGKYGGRRYFDEETVELFASRVPESTRRGMGFDMKELDANEKMHMSELASDETFGHTGFTGTCFWADPEHDLIFVFLSNRTYPTSRGNKLSKLEIRERLHTVVYKSLMQ